MLPVREATVVVCIILPILGIMSVGLRFAARKVRQLPLLADDWIILISLVTTVAACILTVYGVISRGLGLGPVELMQYNWQDAFKVFYAVMLLIYFTQGATKISVVLFYKRIFSVRHFITVANVMVAIIISWAIALFTVEALNSWNIPGFWNDKLANYSAFNETMTILDFVLDLTILILPVPFVQNLQTDRKQRYSIIGIFALGSIAVIASALRIYYNYEFLRFNQDTSEEWKTYISTSNSLWLAIEACISIIAACLPTIGAFLKGYRAQKIKSNSAENVYTHSNKNTAKYRNSWIPLHQIVVTNARANRINSVDEQFKFHNSKSILVERSFETRNESSV